MLRKDNFLVPIFSVVKSIPMIQEMGITFISLILLDNSLYEKPLLIYDPLDFRLFGVNEVCFQLFGINPTLCHDMNEDLSDRTLFKLFPKLLDYTTRNSLNGQLSVQVEFNFDFILEECIKNPYNKYYKDTKKKEVLEGLAPIFLGHEKMVLKLSIMRTNEYQLGIRMGVITLEVYNEKTNEKKSQIWSEIIPKRMVTMRTDEVINFNLGNHQDDLFINKFYGRLEKFMFLVVAVLALVFLCSLILLILTQVKSQQYRDINEEQLRVFEEVNNVMDYSNINAFVILILNLICRDLKDYENIIPNLNGFIKHLTESQLNPTNQKLQVSLNELLILVLGHQPITDIFRASKVHI